MPKIINLKGHRFGKLTVVKMDRLYHHRSYWICKCDCGNIKSISSFNLRTGGTKSCGCLTIEANKKRLTIHGRYKTPEYRLWRNSRHRAKINNIPFDLEIDDIVIPELCPVLGIPLFPGNLADHENSPSLDRFYPKLGYIKENIHVISYKANRIKNDMSFDEFEKVYNWYKSETTKRGVPCQ